MVPPPTLMSPRPLTAHNDICPAEASALGLAGGYPGHPGQRQVLHIGLIDLIQRAIALAGVVSAVSRPGVLKRLREDRPDRLR